MDSRIWTVLSAVIAGVLLGAVMMQLATPPVSGTSVPSHGLTAATGCEAADDPRAWIGVVPNADHRAVYLMNYTALHDAADVEIRGELTEPTANAWRFAITVTPVTSEKTVPDTCQPRSVIDAAIALPAGAESLTITIDGEPIAVVDTASSSPRFRYLDG